MSRQPFKVFPKSSRAFFADSISIDHGGNPVLMGMYPDDTIVLQLPKEVPNPTREVPIGLPQLSVLFSFSACKGTFQSRIEVDSPDGQRVFDTPTNQLEASGGGMNFVARFSPMVVTSLGKHEVRVTLDKHLFTHSFEIRRTDNLSLAEVKISNQIGKLNLPKPEKQSAQKSNRRTSKK